MTMENGKKLLDLQYQAYELMEVQDGIRVALKKNQDLVTEKVEEIMKDVPGVWHVGQRVKQLQRVRHKVIEVTKVTGYVEWKMKWVDQEGELHQKQVRDYLILKVSYAGRQVLKSGELSEYVTKMHTYEKYDPPMVYTLALDGEME